MERQLTNLVKSVGEIERIWSLEGGVSATVEGIEVISMSGERKKLVLKKGKLGSEAIYQSVLMKEFQILSYLTNKKIPVPTPLLYDETGLLMEYIEHEKINLFKNLNQYMNTIAKTLAEIHQINDVQAIHFFLLDYTNSWDFRLENPPQTMDYSLQEPRIRETLRQNWQKKKENEKRLLHGDFWPGNLLWSKGKIVSIIDWEDAAIGDPLSDVANARLEILWAFGKEAMFQFTHYYQSYMPHLQYYSLPIWDLVAALRPASKMDSWGLDNRTLERFKNLHRWFVNDAIRNISKNISSL